MEHDRYRQNKHFSRRYPRNQHHPYERGRQHNPPERVFDHRGREIFNDSLPHHYKNEPESSASMPQEPSPLEQKARTFLHTVLGQEGIRSKLIFLETIDRPLQTLQGTVDYHQMQLSVDQNAQGDFVLKINQEEVTKGAFPNKQAAKNALAEQAMNILKKDCFYIIKKKVYEEVSTKGEAPGDTRAQPQQSLEGSKAHQMMLKMGWGGKGLGVNEQGAQKTVAETIDQNVSRQGLGTDNVFKKIHKLLEDYSKSDSMSLLRFDPDFTSEERAHIHKIANIFGLKSKSEGKGEQRRITITKKLHRDNLVYNLLTCGLENDLYRLIIPAKFEHLWYDDEGDDEDYQPRFSS